MSELRGYIALFRKHLLLVFGGAFLFAAVATTISYFIPPCYEASASLYIARKVEEEKTKEYFAYEGFYAQQAAERYTETVVGLLTSEDIVRQALRKIDRADDPKAVKETLRKIKARRVAPQLVNLKVRQKSASETQALWKALSDSAIETARSLNREGDKNLSISLLEKDPLVRDKKPMLGLNGLMGFLGGLVIFAMISSLIEYLGNQK